MVTLGLRRTKTKYDENTVQSYQRQMKNCLSVCPCHWFTANNVKEGETREEEEKEEEEEEEEVEDNR